MNAQFRFDHISLGVRDLAVSSRFYGDILGLTEIENKTGRPTIRWFAFDGYRALHLITLLTGNDEPAPDRPLAAHLALSTPDFDRTLQELAAQGVVYVNLAREEMRFSHRADGVRQCYFRDPDNYWIEVCEANPDGTVG